MNAFYAAVTGTPWGLAGFAALATTALGVLAALGTIVYEDFQPKGRHHRA
ncbi:hypothetical protein EDD29_7432 [Actinocorallia herbida]|uniref:Uncharacterized protein n=1 Tax=Actinocorallia herbida TaxID=58109 RepID=A0A3N1D8B2_9ACTN|nr:hypothetical protein EDD29_7432 [Actinocorallia herbida]